MTYARLQTVLLRCFEAVDNARRWHKSMSKSGYKSDRVALASYEAELLQIAWEIDALGWSIEKDRGTHRGRKAPKFWELQVALERTIAYFQKRSRAYGEWRRSSEPCDAEVKAAADAVASQATWLLSEIRKAISEGRRRSRAKKVHPKPIELKSVAEVEKKLGGVQKSVDSKCDLT